MVKYLTPILLLLPALICAQDSGNFVLNTTTQMADTWLNELSGTQAVNYGADTFMVIGDEPGLSTEERALFRGTVLPDSMAGRTAVIATLNLVVLSEGIAAAAQIVVHAVDVAKAWREVTAGSQLGACWDFAKVTVSETTDTLFWASEGCKTSGTDFNATTLDSVDITSVAPGDTISLDITAAVNAGIKDFIVYLGNCSNANGINVFSSEAVSKQSFISVDWQEAGIIEPASCSDAEWGSTDLLAVAKYTTKTFNATLDSMMIKVDPVSGTTDTIWAVVYALDSTFIEKSDSVLTNGATICTEFMLHFDGTSVIKKDSTYFFGAYVNEDADVYNFCVIGGGVSGDCVIAAPVASPPNPLSGTAFTKAYCPCFTAYLTASTITGAQAIIISSCESEQTPYFDGQSWSNLP